MNAWIRHGGGQELWDELAGEFGLKAIMAGSTGCQAGGWFNKEINSADDFNGLKMRIPGLGGDVIGKLGGSPVTVPGGQIYENLVSGAIDATEWVGAWNDEIMKFYEAAKYYYTSGMHEPGSMIAAGFNAKFWADLSNTDRAIIEAAATSENEMMMSEYNGKSGAALERLKTDHGVQIRSFNDDVWDSLAGAADEVFEETRAHSDLANRIHESFEKARNEIGGWIGLSAGEFLNQRNRIYKS
jgi:TRAP-type mannitol/chloroaromatic compound transport system substrate-binding protein